MAEPLQHIRFAGRTTRTANYVTKRSRTTVAPSSEGVNPFIAWVLERAGLDAACYRAAPLERRLAACLRALHARTEAEGRQILERRPELLATAVSALLIGVTAFFRDRAVFEALRTEVVPLLSRRRRPLRIWSAGCANGAELYSMAILLAEAGLLEGSYLLGSDCRRDAVEQARTARHELPAREAAPLQGGITRFSEKQSWHPIEPLRRCLHWKVADLNRGVEAGPWDMLLWRNMAIYLTSEVAASTWQALAAVLSPGGVLVVGQAERPPAELPLTCVSRCIYRLM